MEIHPPPFIEENLFPPATIGFANYRYIRPPLYDELFDGSEQIYTGLLHRPRNYSTLPDYFVDEDTIPVAHVKLAPFFGSQLLYGSATGLERAMADTDADRAYAINAELIIENWDPWMVQTKNIPFLAWAMGVNLWPDFWTEAEQRSWMARQFYLKSIRGTQQGLREYIRAMRGELMRVIAPPAIAYAGKSYDEEERIQFINRFAQLRIYPYVASALLPYNCFMHTNWRNGGFVKRFFTTNADTGGRYKRIATLWDRGEETTLTIREIKLIGIDEPVRQYDEIIFPARKGNKYYAGEPDKYPRSGNPMVHAGLPRYRIFAGALPGAAERVAKIPRDGSLTINHPKAQYTTIKPEGQFIYIYPERKFVEHFITHKHSLSPRRKGQFLRDKFLPKTVSWRFIYEVWYLFDPDRVPDVRKRNLFMGNQWFGIPWFTAKARVKIFGRMSPLYFHRFVGGYWKPANDEAIQRARAAINASRALRDTVLIDTKIRRMIQVRDLLQADGKRKVGELIDA